jgi:hypothetical protein
VARDGAAGLVDSPRADQTKSKIDVLPGDLVFAERVGRQSRRCHVKFPDGYTVSDQLAELGLVLGALRQDFGSMRIFQASDFAVADERLEAMTGVIAPVGLDSAAQPFSAL